MNVKCSYLNKKNHLLEQQNLQINSQMQEILKENMEMKYQLGIASNIEENS